MVLIPDEGTCNSSNSDPHLSPPASQVLPGHIAFYGFVCRPTDTQCISAAERSTTTRTGDRRPRYTMQLDAANLCTSQRVRSKTRGQTRLMYVASSGVGSRTGKLGAH
ncbi:hypothetical protein HYQ46_000769 [Verticillium longisporum]|nr:hypothetical protein HYQ46_000769 [Verticillium longisporum]